MDNSLNHCGRLQCAHTTDAQQGMLPPYTAPVTRLTLTHSQAQVFQLARLGQQPLPQLCL